MDPANKDKLLIFEFLESEAHCTPRQKDDVIASNLYYVSLPHSLGILSGVTDEAQRSEMQKQNNWLQSIIPGAQNVYVLNFDKIKEYVPDCHELKSCDAFFYKSNSEKCFLIEFKATTKEKLIKMLDLKTDKGDALIKKIAHSKTILERVCFNSEETLEDLVARTHVVIVYDGKNTEASSTAVRSLLPQKKQSANNGKQKQASFQRGSSKKEISQPTKRFADCIQQKYGFCSVTKKEFPGAAYPDDSPRHATFMTALDFSKAVDALFSDWGWGDYLPYFTGMTSDANEAVEKVLEPV